MSERGAGSDGAAIARRITLLTVTDVLATGVFAVEGSLAGAGAGLNLFGIAVVGFLTAVGGGITRDLLLGDTPPAALRSKVYPVVIAVGVVVALAINGLPGPVADEILTALDAGGLGLFAATGAAKALDHHSHAWVAVVLGIMTGCGGGVLRDAMLNRIPLVLTGNLYATAAAAGALTIVLLERTGSRTVAFIAGIVVCTGLRLLSVHFGWSLQPPSF